jgi:hypothetical protein
MAKTLDEWIEGFDLNAEYYRDDSIISSDLQQVADLLVELRQLRCSTPMHQRDLIEEVERLAVENAKLKELATGLYEDAWHISPSTYRHRYAWRLRDLGIEVDIDE